MTTSTNKQQQLYGEYINPTNEQYSMQKENPLLLMAQVCHNIGKELNSLSSPPSSFPSKPRKFNSPTEGKNSFKRTVPRSSVSPPTKKIFVPQSSSLIFDSLFNQHLNKTFSSSSFNFSPFNYSAFSPTFPRSSYFMDSILSSPFVCNWINSVHSDGLCGKRFTNHFHLLEHLCTEHSSIQPSSLSSYPPTSIEKI